MIRSTTFSIGQRSCLWVVEACLVEFNRLDEGNGKDLSLDDCSREQLEKEVNVVPRI